MTFLLLFHVRRLKTLSQVGIIQLTSFNSNEVNLLTDALYSLSRKCKIIRDVGEKISFIYYVSMVDFGIEEFVQSKADLLGYLAKGKRISAIRVLVLGDTGIHEDCQTECWSFENTIEGTLRYSATVLDFNLYTFFTSNESRILRLYNELEKEEVDMGEYLYTKRLEGTDLSFTNPLYSLNRVLDMDYLLMTNLFDVMLGDIDTCI